MTRKRMSFTRALLLFCLCLTGLWIALGPAAAADRAFPADAIGTWIDGKWKESGIPGMSVIVVDSGGIVYNRNLGCADAERRQAVGADTLFELGSLSKAFTGLAVLQLEQAGKLKLSDPVSRYLPWFKVNFENGSPEITIGQLLYQTSGVPFKSIGFLPQDDGSGMLEKTVRTLIGTELSETPGKQFLYATINYDVLGLIVEKVAGEPFDSYLQNRVIGPLELKHTFAGYGNVTGAKPSQGFKVGYLSSRLYDAPPFSGNTPAAYVISNAGDMARWMMLQMGTAAGGSFDGSLIDRSHIPDRTVPPNGDGSSYGAGWAIYQKGGGEWSHGGTNPTFSSYIVLRPEEKIGVAVLANMNSDLTSKIGQGVMDLMLGQKPEKNPVDYYTQIDRVAMCMLVFAFLAGAGLLYSYGQTGLEIVKGKRSFAGIGRETLVAALLSAFSLAVCLTGLYFLPNLLFWELPWSFVEVWASPAVLLAVRLFAVLMILYACYVMVCRLYPLPREKPVLTIVMMSLLSGFGNAFIVFMINQSFQQGEKFPTTLFMYFVMGILFYVYAQKIVRTQMVRFANQMLYEKRMEIVDRMLASRYANLERMDAGKVNAALISDTETISNSINMAISGITSVITLLFCFIYLGFLNVYGLLISTAIILAAGTIFYTVSARVNRLWEITRDIQNVFFKFADDLIKGFKELSLHARKRNEFQQDMEGNSRLYKDKRSQGDLMFADVYVIGELMFTVVIGVVAFLFPQIFKQMGSANLRNYVFVFLYMTGPINGVLNAIPQMIGIRISWKRVNALLDELSVQAGHKKRIPAGDKAESTDAATELSLERVVYHYPGGGSAAFKLGPVDYTFRAGEIVFITGGNGSGKSTLSKVITGLSSPDEGAVQVNGRPAEASELGELFSVVFSDFHLFERIYGLNVAGREQEIDEYLHLLQLKDKVEIRNGLFSTTKLSSGQRKRLALLLCYLDDRPFYLFDEWAADQDPEYRDYFYTHLLKRMKQQGKGVIAITHDDRYFHLADKVLKLEFGQVTHAEQYALQRRS